MSPVEVARKFVDMNRGTGRTTALIKSLPNERCAVVTLSVQRYEDIKNRIAELRPEYDLTNVEFVTYRPGSGWRDKLIGQNMDVYFDNDVLDDIIVHHVSGINEIYGKRITSL